MIDPNWADDVPKTPPEERYGGGVGFHEEEDADESHTSDNTEETDAADESQSRTFDERAGWLTPSTEIEPEDVGSQRGSVCPVCLEADDELDVARGSFGTVTFGNLQVFYQLLEKHGLTYAGRETTDPTPETSLNSAYVSRTYVAADGLRVVADTKSGREKEGYLSSIEVYGPAGAATAFTEDLLSVVKSIKREHRALSLVDHANAADDGERIEDEHRLISRGESAEVVRRLASAGGSS
jgi:hypothetical protein